MNKIWAVAGVLTAIVVSVLFLPVLQISADAKDTGFGEPGMVWRLDLTKDQKEMISNKESGVEKEILQIKKIIRSQRDQLDILLSADKPDNITISAVIDNISKNMAEIQKKQIFFMLWIREQLTSEQREKLLSIIKNRQQTEGSSGEARGF